MHWRTCRLACTIQWWLGCILGDEDWEDVYHDDPKAEADVSTAAHWLKHGFLEDAYNKRWQAIVNFGKWIAVDESLVAGWYHSAMTIGPEPKPIKTDTTLHMLCITEGCLLDPYGGTDDQDMDVHNPQSTIHIQQLNWRWSRCMIWCFIPSRIEATVLSVTLRIWEMPWYKLVEKYGRLI